HNFTTRTGCIHRSTNQCSTPHSENYGVSATSIGLCEHALDYVFSTCMNWMFQTVIGCNRMALGVEVGGEDLARDAAREDGMHQAYGSLTDDQHRIIGREIQKLDAFEDSIDGLDEGGLLKGNTFGNAHDAAVRDHEIHHPDVFGKPPARGLEACGDPRLFIEWTLRGRAFTAVVALTTGYMVEGHDPIANFETGNARPDGHNGASHLVTEDARGGMGAKVNLLEIRSAYATGGDLDQQLAQADARDRNGLDPHVVDAVIDHGPHGVGQFMFQLA